MPLLVASRSPLQRLSRKEEVLDDLAERHASSVSEQESQRI
jgi:hypothetical protein